VNGVEVAEEGNQWKQVVDAAMGINGF